MSTCSEDIKWVSRIRKSNKDREHNGRRKKDKQRSTKTTQKTKDRATHTPLKPGVNSCSPEGIAIPVPLVGRQRMIRSSGETTLTATGNAWTLCKLRQNISCSTCNVPTLNLHKRYLTCNECATLHARHPLWPRSRLSVLQPDNTTHRRLPLRVEKWTTVTSNQLVKILHFSWFLTLYMLTQHVVSVTKLSCLVTL
jgi:hypothetical protein